MRKIADDDKHLTAGRDFHIGNIGHLRFQGKRAEGLVEKAAQLGGGNGPDDGDLEIVAGQHMFCISGKIVARDILDRVRRAVIRERVRVVAKGCFVPGIRRDPVRRLAIAFHDRPDLGANTLNRVLVETRLGNRQREKSERLVLPVRQRPQRGAEIIIVGGEGKPRRDVLDAGLEFLG